MLGGLFSCAGIVFPFGAGDATGAWLTVSRVRVEFRGIFGEATLGTALDHDISAGIKASYHVADRFEALDRIGVWQRRYPARVVEPRRLQLLDVCHASIEAKEDLAPLLPFGFLEPRARHLKVGRKVQVTRTEISLSVWGFGRHLSSNLSDATLRIRFLSGSGSSSGSCFLLVSGDRDAIGLERVILDRRPARRHGEACRKQAEWNPNQGRADESACMPDSKLRNRRLDSATNLDSRVHGLSRGEARAVERQVAAADDRAHESGQRRHEERRAIILRDVERRA
jgi:hypothetical protein